MATATATVERWEVEELAECIRCGGEMTVGPAVVMGIELRPGQYLCDPCFIHRFNGSKAQVLAHLGLDQASADEASADEASADGDGDEGPDDDDDPTPTPPAAPARRPSTLWLLIGGQMTPRELTPAEEQELDEFLEACRASAPDPEPCLTCNRPASPATIVEGGVLCLTCVETFQQEGTPLERCWQCDTLTLPHQVEYLPGDRPVCRRCAWSARRTGEWAEWTAECLTLDRLLALTEAAASAGDEAEAEADEAPMVGAS